MMTRMVVSALFLLTVVLQGCAGPERLPAVPADQQGRAVVPGVPGVRYRADFDIVELTAEGEEVLSDEVPPEGIYVDR